MDKDFVLAYLYDDLPNYAFGRAKHYGERIKRLLAERARRQNMNDHGGTNYRSKRRKQTVAIGPTVSKVITGQPESFGGQFSWETRTTHCGERVPLIPGAPNNYQRMPFEPWNVNGESLFHEFHPSFVISRWTGTAHEAKNMLPTIGTGPSQAIGQAIYCPEFSLTIQCDGISHASVGTTEIVVRKQKCRLIMLQILDDSSLVDGFRAKHFFTSGNFLPSAVSPATGIAWTAATGAYTMNDGYCWINNAYASKNERMSHAEVGMTTVNDTGLTQAEVNAFHENLAALNCQYKVLVDKSFVFPNDQRNELTLLLKEKLGMIDIAEQLEEKDGSAASSYKRPGRIIWNIFAEGGNPRAPLYDDCPSFYGTWKFKWKDVDG